MIAAATRHIHANEEDAVKYGIKDKDIVKVRVEGIRGGTLDNLLVRVNANYALELHIDTDEANAFALKNGDLVMVIVE